MAETVEICAYCGTDIEKDDDPVQCCGNPYHNVCVEQHEEEDHEGNEQ